MYLYRTILRLVSYLYTNKENIIQFELLEFTIYWSRDPLREGASDEELLDIISNAVNDKKRKHAGNIILLNLIK